jgi:hypothetical protein
MLATECGCPLKNAIMASCPLVCPRNKKSRETSVCVAGTSAGERCRQARAAAQTVLEAPRTSQSTTGSACRGWRSSSGARVARPVAGVVWRSGPRGAPRSVPRNGCRARRRRARPYIGRPQAHIIVFGTRRPHAEGFGVLLVRLRHRGPASVTERVHAIGTKRTDEESVLGTNDEERCACGRAGPAHEEKRRTGDGGERTGTAILKTLVRGYALAHVLGAQT